MSKTDSTMTTKIQDKMFALAKAHLKNAYAPYSKFPVTVCLRSEDDRLFAGVNVENASFTLGTCAETGAVAAMIAAGGREILDIVILSMSPTICPPCGGCLQRLFEFGTPETVVYLGHPDKGILQTWTLKDLLPHAFSARTMERE